MAKENANLNLVRNFRPMGFTLQVVSNSSAIIAASEDAFARFGPVDDETAPDFNFHFFEHEVDDPHLHFPVFRQQGHLIYQTASAVSTLVADCAEGFAFGYFSPALLANRPLFRAHFVELAFFVMLSRHGLMGVHGAALVKNNRAALLRAQSGGGKTTLAYAGARRNLQAMAEDVVWLDTKNEIWWGMPWTFHLLPDAKALFSELAPYQPVLQTNEELKLEVFLETIRPNSTTVSALPGPVILVERLPGGRSKLEPIDRATAKPLWLAGYAGTEKSFPGYQTYIDELLAANTYRLYFGDDIDDAVDLVEALLDEQT